MSCCGKKTNDTTGSLAGTPLSFSRFEYTGRTALTAVGPVTGDRYRFSATGDVQMVDDRDKRGIATIPNLREVTGNE